MKTYLLLILVFLIGQLFAKSADTKNENAAELITQAESRMNIFALPSFEMKADVQVDNNGKPLDGSYAFYWDGPDRWREEITFPGYNEVQIGGKGVVFIKRSTDFLPLRIGELHGTLGYGSSPEEGVLFHLDPRPDEVIKKIHDRKIHGMLARCIELVDQKKHERSVCIDKASGILVRGGRFLDGDIAPIGPKLFPRMLAWVENGKRLVEVRIKELQTVGQFQPDLFVPPKGASTKSGCMNPMPWHRIASVAPKYPEQDRMAHIEGTVSLYVLIGTDGVPRNVKVVSGATPTLQVRRQYGNGVMSQPRAMAKRLRQKR